MNPKPILQPMQRRRKLGMILENKVVQKLKLEKKMLDPHENQSQIMW